MRLKSIGYVLVATSFILLSQTGFSQVVDSLPNDKKQANVMESIKDQKKIIAEFDFKKLAENIQKAADDCLKAATVTDDAMFLRERDNCAISTQQASTNVRSLDTNRTYAKLLSSRPKSRDLLD